MTLGRRDVTLPSRPCDDPTHSPLPGPVAAPPAVAAAPRLCALVVPLTPAIDAAEGVPATHAMRTALVGMRIGRKLGLETHELNDLYYASLLKDLGATSARSKAAHTFGPGTGAIYHALHHADLSTLRGSLRLAMPLLRTGAPLRRRVANFVDITLGRARGPAEVERLRSRSGASIALDMGFSRGTADAILSQNERWDGRGRPDAYAGVEIVLSGRILNVAQSLVSAWFDGGPEAAAVRLAEQAGTRLDPELVAVALRLLEEPGFVAELSSADIAEAAITAEPTGRGYASASRVDRFFSGFARFIDAKSPWKYRHSERVRELAVGTALQLGDPYRMGSACLRRLKRAALLHDVARLATPSELLDSSRRLSDTELQAVRAAQPVGQDAIERVLDMADAAPITETYAGAEPAALLDQRACARSPEERAELIATLLSLAEKFEALTAPRPHRERKSFEEAVAVLRSETAKAGQMCRAAMAGLELFLATPSAAAVLTPRTFDPNAIVVVD